MTESEKVRILREALPDLDARLSLIRRCVDDGDRKAGLAEVNKAERRIAAALAATAEPVTRDGFSSAPQTGCYREGVYLGTVEEVTRAALLHFGEALKAEMSLRGDAMKAAQKKIISREFNDTDCKLRPMRVLECGHKMKEPHGSKAHAAKSAHCDECYKFLTADSVAQTNSLGTVEAGADGQSITVPIMFPSINRPDGHTLDPVD